MISSFCPEKNPSTTTNGLLFPCEHRYSSCLFPMPTTSHPERSAGYSISRVDSARADSIENPADHSGRSEEHTSELQSLAYIVCRLLLEKKNSSMRRRLAS